MTYKTILVHVDATAPSAARLELAAGLARRFDAHLVGVYAQPEMLPVSTATSSYAVKLIIEQQRLFEERAERTERLFNETAAAAGLPGFEWQKSTGENVAAVAMHARFADLVVIGQPGPETDAGVEPDFAHRLVLVAGRPVLVVPYADRYPIVGKRVMLAWNSGREAIRAATDALPLLRDADEVIVITAEPVHASHRDIPGADIGLYLTRHGVRVRVESTRAAGIDVGNLLLSRAADLSCDLIVMGAYGHSRISELVLGGVTRTLFEEMTIPVLMSH